MASKSRRIPVEADTLTRLDTEVETDKTGGSSLVVRNRSSSTCEIGGADLVLGEGFDLLPNESFPFPYLPPADKGIYARCASAIELQVFESGV